MPFVECDTCRAKPGSPSICGGCYSNRCTIDRLEKENTLLREQAMKERWYETVIKYAIWVGVYIAELITRPFRRRR